MNDQLIDDVRFFSGGKNITESLVLALTDWLNIQKLKALNNDIEAQPLRFADDFDASRVRQINRRRKAL